MVVWIIIAALWVLSLIGTAILFYGLGGRDEVRKIYKELRSKK